MRFATICLGLLFLTPSAQAVTQFNRDDVQILDRGKTCGFRCEGDVQVISIVNSQSQCQPATTTSCFPYGCNTATSICRTRCDTTKDCATGNVCHFGTNRCVVNTKDCAGPFAVRDGDGSEQSCKGFQCIAGACRSTCLKPNECDATSGYSCVNRLCTK